MVKVLCAESPKTGEDDEEKVRVLFIILAFVSTGVAPTFPKSFAWIRTVANPLSCGAGRYVHSERSAFTRCRGPRRAHHLGVDEGGARLEKG